MNDPFSPEELRELPVVLSAPRFATYLQARGGDRTEALRLYRWNLAVSGAFMVPLHILEITLRNGVVQGIEAIHGGAWPWTQGFLLTLPNPGRGAYSPRQDLLATARRHPTAGKVVADLRFAFWERMLLKSQQRIVWDRQFAACFPHAPPGQGASASREHLRRDVEAIRRLRNRIAHHEPIFARDLGRDLDTIRRAVRWRSTVAEGWLDKMEGVTGLLGQKP